MSASRIAVWPSDKGIVELIFYLAEQDNYLMRVWADIVCFRACSVDTIHV